MKETELNNLLSQVESELEQALGSINKSEEVESEITEEQTEEVAVEETELNKSEEVEEEAAEEEYTIEELYDSMSKSEKEAHYAAIKKSLFSEEESEELEKAEDEEEDEEEKKKKAHKKDHMKEPKKVEKCGDMKMGKSEETLEKSEIEIENEELKKSLAKMEGLVEQLFSKKSAPQRKSITEEYDVIAKSEESEENGIDISSLSKSEITKKLNTLNFEELSKSERNAINEYCLNNGSVDSIKHLIKG